MIGHKQIKPKLTYPSWLKILSSILLVSALLSACQKPEPEKVARPIYTMIVGGPASGTTRSFSGVAKAQKEIALSFRVPGQIIQLELKVGQKVKSQEVLARLDPKDSELKVSQKKSALVDTDAKLQRMNADYERIRKLYESGSSSASELDSALANFRSARAQKETAEKDLELSQQQLNYTTLFAEVDGEITNVPAEVYETVAAGQEIAVMVTGDEIKIEIGIPESVINYLKIGDSAQVKFDTFPGKTFAAKITELGRSPTESTTYPVKLLVIDPDKGIRPGMVGEVTFIFKQEDNGNTLILPLNVIVGEGDERYVWVVDPKTNVVHKRDVKVGNLVAGGVQILNGLKPGELIVTRGIHRVEDGSKVKPIEDTQGPK